MAETAVPVVEERRDETGRVLNSPPSPNFHYASLPHMTIEDYKKVENANHKAEVKEIAVKLGAAEFLGIVSARGEDISLREQVELICGGMLEDMSIESIKRLCDNLKIKYSINDSGESLVKQIKDFWECETLKDDTGENIIGKCRMMKASFSDLSDDLGIQSMDCRLSEPELSLDEMKVRLKNHYIQQQGINWVRVYDDNGRAYFDHMYNNAPQYDMPGEPFIDWRTGEILRRGFATELQDKAKHFSVSRKINPETKDKLTALPGGGRKKRKFKKTNKTRKLKKTNKTRKYKKTNKTRKYKKTNKKRKSNRKKSKR
jgi:hypothetical protein